MKVADNYPKKEEQVREQPQEPKKYSVPTELIELPSKGLVYPKDHPLSSGKIEIKYMTAREEDILTTQSFIEDNSVIDRFLNSIIVTEGVTIDDMNPGDVNALTIAARIHGYGQEYEGKVQTPSGTVQALFIDLSELELEYLNEDHIDTPHVNEFSYKLPASGVDVKFKLITWKELNDYQKHQEQNTKQKKKNAILKNSSDSMVSSYLKLCLIEVEGQRDRKYIEDFVSNMLAIDSRSLRKYITAVSPNVDRSLEVTDRKTGETFPTELDFGPQFFWPDSQA